MTMIFGKYVDLQKKAKKPMLRSEVQKIERAEREQRSERMKAQAEVQKTIDDDMRQVTIKESKRGVIKVQESSLPTWLVYALVLVSTVVGVVPYFML